MPSPEEPKKPPEEHPGTSLFPVPGLALTSDIDHELAIGRVTFICGPALLRRRKRFGLTDRHVAYLSGKEDWLNTAEEFKAHDTYAVVRTARTRKEDIWRAEQLVREAIFLLASSQTTASASYRRRARAFGQLPGSKEAAVVSFTLRSGGLIGKSWNLRRDPMPFTLDASWKGKGDWHYWWPLMKIIFGKPSRVTPRFKKRLRHAAVAIGRSVFADSVSQAFLLDIIALEALICTQGNSISKQLIDTTWALHHWALGVDRENLSKAITEVYSLRSSIVHDGDLSGITVEHLSLADALLFNTLNNICRVKFSSVAELEKLAEQVRAYECLSMKPKRLPRRLLWIGSSFTAQQATQLREKLLP